MLSFCRSSNRPLGYGHTGQRDDSAAPSFKSASASNFFPLSLHQEFYDSNRFKKSRESLAL